jgi:hypothetical protein
MAQAGFTPIQLYFSTTAAAVPTSGNLANGELAINITDGKLYYKSNAGVVTLLAGATAGPAGGSNTQVQFNSSGALAGSANMTFNGTTLTAGGLTSSGVLDVNGTTDSTSITTGSAVIDGGAGIAKSLFVGGNATITKDTATSFLRLQSLAPYGFPGDYSITAGGQSTPALTISDNTAGQERLNFLTGETVFNEAGADQDFRIESDTEGNMFFLDAGNNRIGFKTNTPVSYLTVGGAYDQFLTFQDFRTNPSGTYDSYMAWQSFGTTPLLLGFTQNDYSNINRRFFIKYSNDNVPTYYERMGIGFYETVFNENSIDVDFRVESDANTHMLFVDASSNVVSIGSSATNAWSTYIPLQIGSSTFVTDTGAGATFSQFVHGAIFNGATWNQLYTDVTASRIELSGISTGSIQNFYTANNVTAGTATTQILNLTLSPTAAVFNEDSRDIDFRVESDSNTHALFVDAGNSVVQINNSTPVVSWTSGRAMDVGIAQTGVTYPGLSAYAYSSATGNSAGGMIILGRSGSNTVGTTSATSNGDAIGYLSFEGVGTNNSGYVSGVYMAAVQDGAGGATSIPGRLGFFTGTASSTPVERFRVGSTEAAFNAIGADYDFRVESDANAYMFFVDAGNNAIGINDSSPSYQMDFGGGTTVSRRIQLQRGSDDSNQNMLLGWSGIDVTRTSNGLGTAQSTFSLNQVGSDGTRNVLFVTTDGGITLNEDSYDADFRVESDASTHMLFVDAGTNTVNINTPSPMGNAKLGVYAASGISQVNQGVAGNSQGNPQCARVVRFVTATGTNLKLIIPFLSQGSLNSTTICRLMGHNAQYNIPAPQGFEVTFAVGHLNALYSLASWGTGGTFSSITTSGMNVEITFSSSYGTVYGEAGGMFITLEYMSNNLSYSIQPDSIVMA